MTNWFRKMAEGLKKSSDKLTFGLSNLLGRKALDIKTRDELEETLLMTDMGITATTRILAQLSARKTPDESLGQTFQTLLAEELENILSPCQQPFILPVDQKPIVILMIGVNGAGKTTTIGKLSAKWKAEGKRVSLIAADTFRAAAVEQLQAWGQKTNTRVFSGPQGCDSAGLCFDGLRAAKEAKDDIVLIDTAGRLQNKNNLMDELQKLVRVIQKIMPTAPHKTLLTIDATTGQNALAQVEGFAKICPISGLVVTKLDGSAKGGILVALAAENPLPVYFIGVGEQTDDLDIFNAKVYARALVGLPVDESL